LKEVNCPSCAELVRLNICRFTGLYWGKCKVCGAEFELPKAEFPDTLTSRKPKTRAEFQLVKRILEGY
jgi:hypothetical protein